VSLADAYYGQEGEDAVLNAFLQDHSSGKGFFVDIGAHHPVRFSNSWRFYQQGWRGINIDPTPGSMAIFEDLRSEDINLELAVSVKEGKRKFFCYNEPALNGIDNDRTVELRETHYRLEAVVDVPTRPLAGILNEAAHLFLHPNFISIDVEGHEMEVLMSNNWDLFTFDFVLVEQRIDDLTRIGQSEIYKYLLSLNYTPVACTGRTVIYRKTS